MSEQASPEQPAPGGTNVRRRQRRKEARPSEIIEAALELFGERGFGATRLEDVARRAGVAKGTLFVYFPTKQDLFRAVARSVLAVNLEPLQQAASQLDRPAELIPALLVQAAHVAETRLPTMMRLLIGEGRAFPDLAQVWHDEVVSKVLGGVTMAIARAQARGEIRPGDPRLHAFSIVGPILAGVIFREVFGASDAPLPDLKALAAQHARTVLDGLLIGQDPTPSS
jgi:AcrR family transcriptional regulator